MTRLQNSARNRTSMTILRTGEPTQRPANEEHVLRAGVALVYTIGLTSFFIWFIATHLTRYGN